MVPPMGHPLLNSLGPLERQLLDLVYEQGPVTVRDLLPAVPHLAYTTVMTTLDRLHRKGFLVRVQQGRAFAYTPRTSREVLHAALAAQAIADAIDGPGLDPVPVLSSFVAHVGDHDPRLLDELERLVRNAKASRGGKA